MKVTVIGAGILGASIAYCLSQRPGIEITVLDRSQPGSGASSHTFAWTNAFDKEPRHYHELNARSMEMWHRFVRDLKVDQAFSRGGELNVENTPQGSEGLRARVRRLQSWGYRCRLIDAAELRGLEPGLQIDDNAVACFSENDGHVDVPAVIAACLDRARAAGAQLRTGEAVTGLRLDSTGRVEAVTTGSGELECDAVVVAAGTDTPRIAAMAGIRIEQPESPGIVIRTDPRPPLFRSVSVIHLPAMPDGRLDIHLRQTPDGAIQIGQGTQESLNRDDSQEHADDLLDRARHYFPALAGARAIPQPVGYRPMPADGLPVIGFPKAAVNLYLAFMHSGVTLAPLVGELAALEIAEGAEVEALQPYRVERFG